MGTKIQIESFPSLISRMKERKSEFMFGVFASHLERERADLGVGEWHRISTMPRGRKLIVYRETREGINRQGFAYKEGHYWYDNATAIRVRPTHWLPITEHV